MVQQQRATETQAKLVVAAAAVFARQGYRATTLKDITREAAVTQGALYFHFDSKRALAEEIMRRQRASADAARASALASADSGLTSLVRLSAALAEQIVTEPVVRAGMLLSREPADDLGDSATLAYRDWIDTCRTLLDRAAAAGETREGVDLDAAAEVFVSWFVGAELLSGTLSRSEDLLERLARMWPLLLGGMVSDPGHPVLTSTRELIRR